MLPGSPAKRAEPHERWTLHAHNALCICKRCCCQAPSLLAVWQVMQWACFSHASSMLVWYDASDAASMWSFVSSQQATCSCTHVSECIDDDCQVAVFKTLSVVVIAHLVVCRPDMRMRMCTH